MTNSLLTTLIGVVLVATACNCLEFSHDYLKRPQRYFSSPDNMYSIRLLTRLNLEDGASYEQVIESLRAIRPEKRYDKQIELWLDLAEPDGQCSWELPEMFLDLYENLRESTILKHKQLLLDTLTHYGAIKFQSCVSKALETIESAQNEELVVEAERFFKRVLNLEEDVTARDFYRKLRALSVTDADWNVGLLLSEAHDYDKQDYWNKNFVRNKYHFLFVNNCRNFRAYMTLPLAVINLVHDMEPNVDHLKGNDDLRALNELNRVCMDLRRFKQGFIANLEKKISLKSRVKNKLGI